MIMYTCVGILGVLVILQVWWIYRSIQKFLLIRDLFEEAYASVVEYKEHLEYVHGLERYFGDETLKGLIDHGESTVLSLEEFLQIFSEFSEFDRINLSDEGEEIEECDLDGGDNKWTEFFGEAVESTG